MEIKNIPHRIMKKADILYSCQYHIVFCTKKNKKILTGAIKEELEKSIKECQEILGFLIVDISINYNYVHLILNIEPLSAPAKLTTNLKKYTASILFNIFPELKTRIQGLWTRQALIITSGTIEMSYITSFLEEQQSLKKKKSGEKT